MSAASTDLPSPIIEFSGVHLVLGGQPVLRGIDLTIEKGETVVLMGASGCGKTTLLRCINGLERIHQGSLRVNGVNLNNGKVDINAFRARIGMVFQQYNLFPHLTVLENIMLGPVQIRHTDRKAAEEQARHLLAKVGIGEKSGSYPDQLSGGQKQRVAIARSLAMDPDILLLDEPTSALDPPMSKEVLSVIEQLQHEMTMIMVTHELRFAGQLADRLIFMDAGQIVEAGPPAQLMQDPQSEALKRYLQVFA